MVDAHCALGICDLNSAPVASQLCDHWRRSISVTHVDAEFAVWRSAVLNAELATMVEDCCAGPTLG
jgi:hypothetical protein